MKASLSNSNENLSTLLSALYLTLDEAHFFTSLSQYFLGSMKCDQIQVYKILENGKSILMSENELSIEHGLELLKGEGAPGYIARTKRGYFSNTVERDPVFVREAKLGIKAELCLPISAEGIVIGSIHCQMLNPGREFSREDMTLGMSILSEVKGPIQNMKMYLQAKQLNETLLKTIELKEKELQESRAGHKIQDSFKIQEKEIVGRSLPMKELLSLVDRIADKEISAYLLGESATGKEMIARRIHCRSHRRDRSFVAIDCSIYSKESELDVELFGDHSKMGMLEACNYGSVFINHIELMTPMIQNKLLQYINSKMGIKSNGKDFFKSDVRIISASTKDLMDLVSQSKFREDLYFALSAVVLKVPALRDRKEDIEVLANFFLNLNKKKEAHKSFSPGAIKALSEYAWTGNVRELQNVVERAYILSEGSIIEKLHLDQNIQASEKVEPAKVAAQKPAEFMPMTLEELEKNHIMGTLENLSGNKTRAAKVLGITVKTLYNKLHSYGIEFDKEA